MKSKTATADAADTASEDIAQSVTLVPLAHLVGHAKIKNRPIDKDHAQELFLSIQKDGLDQPLDTWAGEKEGATMKVGDESVPANFLITGFHRREALRTLKAQDPKRFEELFPGDLIPVRRREGSLVDMIILQLRENVSHKEPAASELFPKLVQLRDEFKLKSNQIAKRLGRSEPWVSRMLTVSEELGEEGAEAVANNKIGVNEAQRIADESKKAKKAGKPLSSEEKKEKLNKAVEATAARKAKGKSRAEKLISVKTLWGRFKALPAIGLGKKHEILVAALTYAFDGGKLPAELADKPAEKKVEKKAAAKK